MLPYLVPFMAQQVGRSLGNSQHLRMVLRCARVGALAIAQGRGGILPQGTRCLACHQQCEPLPACSAAHGLLSNPHLRMVPYIHHLLPGGQVLPQRGMPFAQWAVMHHCVTV